MAMGDKRAAKLLELVQQRIAEPVHAAAILAPKGKLGAAMGFGLIGVAVQNATQQSAVGFRAYNAFALTDGALHVFEAGVNLGVKVKDPVGSWPWGSFGASTANGSMTKVPVPGMGRRVDLPARGTGQRRAEVPG